MEIPKELKSLTKTLPASSSEIDLSPAIVETPEGSFLSAYVPGTISDKTGLEITNMVRHAFPSITTEFLRLLVSRMRAENFSDQRATDAVNHVIDNCEYPLPTIARFLSFDRRKRVYSYNEMLLFLSQNQGFTTNHFGSTEVGGKKVWFLK